MNLELFFNLMNILFAFGSNNWLSVAISILVFCYNIYLKIQKNQYLSLIVENQKENKSAADRVGMIFKVKFIIYTVISMYALCFAVLHFLDEMEDIGENFKIFNTQEGY